MSLLMRLMSVALIGISGAVTAAARDVPGTAPASETGVVHGADSLVSGSEQAVLEWALASDPVVQDKRRRG